MVRLKVAAAALVAVLSLLFQFQNGSIKSQMQAARELGILQFQFQNGSIKSNDLQNTSQSPYPVSIPKWFD